MKIKNHIPLLTTAIPLDKTIAFITSPRIGDALIAMVTAENLRRHGYQVTVFSKTIAMLAQWFPQFAVHAPPSEADSRDTLSQFDVLIHSYHHDIIGDAREWHSEVIVLGDSPLYQAKKTMVEIQKLVCENDLHLPNSLGSNNLTSPAHLHYRRNRQHVIIHPTSHQLFRNWLPQRFVRLAKRLQQQGYTPRFIVSPPEKKAWSWLRDQNFDLLAFNSLHDAASTIYESGFFIGNDSGIGHLASNLGIPTITLGVRPSLLRQWRPAWAPGLVLLPPYWLPTRQLKEKLWKYFIPVRKVAKAFNQLAENFA